jgi:hypothetical protein
MNKVETFVTTKITFPDEEYSSEVMRKEVHALIIGKLLEIRKLPRKKKKKARKNFKYEARNILYTYLYQQIQKGNLV